MNNAAVVCRIKNVRPHPNADRVQLGAACGYQVVVGLETKEDHMGLYFPTDTCLGKDFAEANPDLLTYFGKNLRVRTQKFRGERSEGFWVPLKALWKVYEDQHTWDFAEGAELTTHEDKEICKKYINPATLNRRAQGSNIAKKLRSGSLPTFQKHVETSHLRKEWDRIPRDRAWVWTHKLHGTSARVGHVRVEPSIEELTFWQKAWMYITKDARWLQPRYEYLIGTRNVILGELKSDGSTGSDGWYGDEFRKEAARPFVGQLHKGEVVYYEIVGYASYNQPIMGKVAVKDKEVKKLYGDEVTYAYGRPNGSFDIYVYRIAYQTEEGQSIDLTWDQVKARCAELGVKHVPEADLYPEHVTLDHIQEYVERPDPIDGSHPLEGVVLRVESSKPEFYKEKSFTFKVLEGIAKDSNVADIEEAS